MQVKVLGQWRTVKDGVRLSHQTLANYSRGKEHYQAVPHEGDLSDGEWRAIEPVLPQHHEGARGRPRKTSLRQQVNATLWLLRHGSSLRDMPAYFGPWGSIHGRLFHWSRDGTLAKILSILGDPALIASAKKRLKVIHGIAA